jgi:hypothetical protein
VNLKKTNMSIPLATRSSVFVWLACQSPAWDDQADDDSTDSSSSPIQDGGTDSDICGEQNFGIEIKPVKLMILMDLSGSMNLGIPTSKWDQAKIAITNILTNWEGKGIHFGFDQFPAEGEDCGINPHPIIDCATANEVLIFNTMNTLNCEALAQTPLYCALNNYTDPLYAPNLSDVDNGDSYLLMVADGCDSCGLTCPTGGGSAADDDFTQVISDVLSLGVHTFAIGFGDATGGEFCEGELNAIAAAGGTVYDTFFDVLGQAALDNALQEIVEKVASCEFVLQPEAGADPTEVNLYADEELILFDEGCTAGSGWDWVDSEQEAAVLCDQPCNQLVTGNISQITATFGCPTAVLE